MTMATETVNALRDANGIRLKGDAGLINELLSQLDDGKGHPRQWLLDRGVPPQAWFSPWPGPMGYATVEPLGGGRYRPAETGVYAYILPVRGLNGEIYDLAAWLPGLKGKSQIWTRCRDSVALGSDVANYQAHAGVPLFLSATLLSWLQGGCESVLVLDWNDPWLWDVHLAMPSRLLCETSELSRMAANIMPPGVDVRVLSEVRHAA